MLNTITITEKGDETPLVVTPVKREFLEVVDRWVRSSQVTANDTGSPIKIELMIYPESGGD